ncbi:MAG: transporter substrate-binding domain-containing protein [Prevotella sp.]|nr:transporter substrate-binding domain-containing protein [Prevotella sp.]
MPLSRIKLPVLRALLLLGVVLCTACNDSLEELFRPTEKEPVVSPLAIKLGFSKERPLVMGMNTSYAPLQYVDDHGTPCGNDVEFTKRLMQRMGIPFTFAPNHWDKMSPGIIEGKYDLGLMVYSPYRKDLTNYSNAVFRMYYQIVYRKKDYADFDFRNLRGKTIAYMKSRPIGLMLTDAGAKDVRITDLGAAFKELAEGKYDGLICYRFQATHYINLLHLEKQLQTEELSLEPREYCYASHDKQLIEAINDELRKTETISIIDEVYGDNVLTQFGVIKIPAWVWLLGVLLTFLFLVIFSINRYRLSKRLQQAHDKLQEAYLGLAEKNVQLKIANERAEESTRMKSNFIKQISHEIRTPLNILSGFTQLITTTTVRLSDKDRIEAGEEIMKNTYRITGLVNKMLELSDINSQVVLERNDTVTPLEIADQAISASGINDARHLVFTLQTLEGSLTPFKTDQRAAARILELLLDNAIKFTRPAEAYLTQVDSSAKKQSVKLTINNSKDTVRFIVDDTGIGIPPKEAEHIFDEFVQLDEYYNGTGVGLTVARSLARRLGGDIWLDTSHTACTRFIIKLPV